MRKIYLGFLACTLLAIFACSDDFTTNPDPLGVDVDTFFESEGNVEQAVIGVYDIMQLTYGRDWHSAFLVKLLAGDDANAAGGNSADQQQLQDIDDYAAVASSKRRSWLPIEKRSACPDSCALL